jgi:hypothetical protein
VEAGGRVERTSRPEEERLADPFRAARPHTDASIVGTTRFEIATASLSRPFAIAGAGGLRIAPLVEASRVRPTALDRPSAFDPARFYGRPRLWNLSAGVLVSTGMPRAMHRMGRYGVARAPHAAAPHAAGPDGGHALPAGPR